MGAVQSLVSDNATTTAVVAAGVALVGAAALTSKPPSTGTPESGEKPHQKLSSKPTVAAPSAAIPGQFEDEGVADSTPEPKPSKSKKKSKNPKPTPEATPTVLEPPAMVPVTTEQPAGSKKKKKSKKAKASGSPPSAPLEQSVASVASVDTDSSWTRVEPKLRKSKADLKSSSTRSATPTAERPTTTTGDEGGTTSGSDESEQGKTADTPRRPLAERLLPKPPKTGVEDMLETPDVPTLARVVRVKPQNDEKPADGFSWGDYEDVDVTSRPAGDSSVAEDDDDGWGFVPVKSRGRKNNTGTTTTTAAPKSTTASSSTTGQSKKQRQNAAKRAAAKAAKEETEKERLELVTKHKKALERERMLAQQHTGKSKGSQLSGGQTASVDEKGRLVWE